ncbi:MAG: hypothetical protein VB080_06420 [Propionicimonas sp.]|uniref:hypothetical protein n=1 Tax=Propionicimonas sp. TaxID=1955623 RepID=UPI002B1F8ED7|nr:hypothetical protein [Propionicimonas sp.]MEA4944060.1 hypothetical protein [Propionicimonas sp.]
MSQPPEDTPRWQTYPGDAEVPPPRSAPASDGPSAPSPGVPAVPPAGYPAPIPQGAGSIGRPGYVPHDPLVLAAGGSGIKKEGVWTVPPYLSIHGDLGSIRLDFRRAEVTSAVIWVQVSAGMGSILLILPEGWAAQLDRLTPGIGSRKSTVAEEPVADNPVLVLSGSAGMGSIRVRYPNRRDERRLRRQLAREQKRLR